MDAYLLFFIFVAAFAPARFYPVESNDEILCSLDSAENLSCRENEECILLDDTADSKSGRCRCVTGYSRSSLNDLCTRRSTASSPRGTTHAAVSSSPLQETTPESERNSSAVLFEVDGPPSVRLPHKTAILRVFLDESEAESESSYKYHWELIDSTGLATAASYNEPSLKLSELGEGRLVFRVTVSNQTHSGSKEYVLTVLPKETANKPPKAIIRPDSPVSGTEGSQVVLDAEGSTDDVKISSFQWSQDEGPSVNLPAMNTAILRLDTLVKGEYNFTVVVTDEGGLSSSASVRVIVSAERDDPPKALINECGSSGTGSISVRLPLDELMLCGNGSTDDKGIASYSWFRVDKLAGKLSVDSAGSSSPILRLTNIQANDRLGPYEFQLDVVDTKGQKDSTRISIFVNRAENMAPVVDAGGNHTVLLPESSIVLDGNVKDDGSIVSYAWEQIGGDIPAVFSNKDKAKSTVSGLEEGDYVFRLTVIDDGGLNASALAYISVQRSKNEPPVARAPNVTVFLPSSIAILNASQSSDDAGIVTWKWEANGQVPAAMLALDGSDSRAVMFVTGLVTGSHLYNLTVTDQQKASSSIMVRLDVKQGPEDLESVELLIDAPIDKWSNRLRQKLQARIEAVLASAIPEISRVQVHFSSFEQIPRDGRLRVAFWAQTDPTASQMRRRRSVSVMTSLGILSAGEVVRILEQEWSMLDEFRIVLIQPLYCQLSCSGHGVCSNATKECECERFWMTSLFTLMGNGGQHTDCAWSSIYFWLSTVVLLLSCSFCVLFRRRSPVWGRVGRRRFVKRRKRYTALNSDSEDVHDLRRMRNEPRLQPLPIPVSSDSLNSESDDLLQRDEWDNMEMTTTGGR